MRLIDADALKEQFKDRSLEDFTHLHFIDAIDNAPTVERIVCRSRNWSNECTHSSSFEQGYTQGYEEGKNDRPKGKWLSHYEYCAKHGCCPSALIAFWWCDQCEQAVEQPTNFCPNCGADMRGEENG